MREPHAKLALGEKQGRVFWYSRSSASRRRPGSISGMGTGFRQCDEIVDAISQDQSDLAPKY
jgi:hypothetical protein